MKKFKLIIPLFTLLVFLAIGSATAASYDINETSYSNYFNNDGSFKVDSGINNGDELVINGEIKNKNFTIDKNVTINGNTNGKMINSTIRLFGSDSSGSTINGISINNVNQNGIEITNGASHIMINNTNIHINGTETFGGYSLYGILATGETSYVNIINNIISMNGNVPYNYGISVSCFYGDTYQIAPNPNNYVINGNKISSNINNTYSAGIYADSPINFTIKNNNLDLMSNNLIYGITITDMFLTDFSGDGNLIPSRGIEISKNSIYGTGNCIFLIEIFQLGIWEAMDDYGEFKPILVNENNLYGKGTSVYGIALGSSHYININGNNITTIGGNYKSINKTNDSAAPIGGIAPINLQSDSFERCQYLNITNNHFESNNGLTVGNTNSSIVPQNITYLGNLQDFIIDDESYSNFFDNEGNFLDNLNVTTNSTLNLGNLFRKKIVIDRMLNIMPYDNASMLLYTQIILKNSASGSIIQNLFFVSDKNVLNLEGSSDNIFKNNRIIIRSIIDDYYPNNSLDGITLTGDSSRNQILNNDIQIDGTMNPTKGAYFYGIQIGSYDGSNPDSNIIDGNTIVVNGVYASALYFNSVKNTIIKNNDIFVNGKDFAYVIVIQDWSYLSSAPSLNNHIINNKIFGKGSMIYLIESINSQGTIVKNNIISGDGDAVYGYASSGSKNEVIEANEFYINGTDVANTPLNFDIIKSSQAGIYAEKVTNMTIKNNKIISKYNKGGDYGVNILNASAGSKNIIENNYLSSDNGRNLGKESIYTVNALDLINNNTPKRTILTLKTSKITVGKKASIIAILKDNDGKALVNNKIQLLINGKSYSSTTNSKGEAIFKISSLKKGNYSIKANYVGNNNYISTLATQKQIVLGIADLKITKIRTNGKRYIITIKNIGSESALKSKFRIWYKDSRNKVSKPLIINTKSLSAGKSLNISINLFKKYPKKKYVVYTQANYNKAVKESNYKNNLKKVIV